MNTRILENSNPSAESVQNSLAKLIEQYAVEEGVTETKYPGLVVARFNNPIPRYPLVYSPCICVVAQGSKHVFSSSDRFVYDPLNYLVVSLPLPLEAEVVNASPDQPFLALALEIDVAMIGKLFLKMSEEKQVIEDTVSSGKPIYTSTMNSDLLNAVERLLRSLESPESMRILGPGVVLEILYHIINGEHGTFLRSVFLRSRGHKNIMKVTQYLQKSFGKQHDISSIAKYAGMSKSTLHNAFEEFVGESPIQYLKKTRLHQARLMIINKEHNVSEAAHEVGYNSTSQFSREFKRQFGFPPSHAADNL